MPKPDTESLELLRAYLPETLIRHWARQPEGSSLWGEWISGSLMHCDITGFTAMSESLATLGKEGAELMAAVLNRFFEPMLQIAERWGGVQMKFGGDAMLLFFSGRQHAECAGACALEMQAAMAEFRQVTAGQQTHPLRMRIGIHSGSFYSASVGADAGMLHYMLLGRDVNRTAAVEPFAGPGQVVLSAEAAALLRPSCRLLPGGHEIWRLQRFTAPLPALPPPQRRGSLPPIIRRYVMPALAFPATPGEISGFAAEHRRVTAMFINLLGASELLGRGTDSDALAQVDAYVKVLLSLLERHSGFLAGSDVAEEGDKLIVLFGAPVSHENQEASALRCALDLERELAASGLELRQRIGINSGFVFAGEIGSARRREYTVIGDSVNLAARLMAAARPGQTIASGRTVQRCADEFDLARMRPLRVKGKAAPVSAWRLQGERTGGGTSKGTGAMLGRDSEIASLLRVARSVARGKGRWVYLAGEAGIGKSRLVAEFVKRLGSRGWRSLAAESHSHTSRVPFSMWTPLLRSLLATDGREPGWDAVTAEVTRLAPGHAVFAPLIGELLSLPAGEDRGLRSLDAATRRQRLTDTVVEILLASARERPLVLSLEDVHWADALSLELLSTMTRRLEAPILICLTSRQETPPPELAASKPALVLRLEPLPPEAAREIASAGGGLTGQQVDTVLQRAQGNPLFLHEFALSGSMADADLPESVTDVMMARLDTLPLETRSVLRVASVAGPSFPVPDVAALLIDRVRPARLRQLLGDLAERGFMRSQGGDPPVYAFSHGLLQEVVYGTLPYSERRVLHGAVLDHMEASRAGHLQAVCELLLHHSEGAQDITRTVRYAAMSGDRAAAIFANETAIDYYRRSLGALGQIARRTGGDRTWLLERVGDCLETLGRHKDAADTYTEALSEWRLAGRPRPRLLASAGGDRAREAVLCRKVGAALERGSDYDGALRWLDEGLAALPRRRSNLAAQMCAARSVALFRKGMYQEGIRWGRRAVELALRSRDLREIAYSRSMLANSYIEHGELRQGIRQLRQAVRLYHELGDLPGQGISNNNLGSCYQDFGVLDAALYHYQVALQTDQRVGDVVDAAIVRNNIGEVLLALGRIDEAIAHFREVVRAQEGGADLAAVAGLAQVNLCRCLLTRGELDAAGRHLRRGQRLLRRLGAQGLLAEAALQHAELLLAQRRTASALRAARRALAQAESLNAQLLQARGERVLGLALAAAGADQSAETHLRAGIALARRIGAEHEEAQSALALARHLLDTHPRRSRAKVFLRRASSVFARMGAQLGLAEAERLQTRLAA